MQASHNNLHSPDSLDFSRKQKLFLISNINSAANNILARENVIPDLCQICFDFSIYSGISMKSNGCSSPDQATTNHNSTNKSRELRVVIGDGQYEFSQSQDTLSISEERQDLLFTKFQKIIQCSMANKR